MQKQKSVGTFNYSWRNRISVFFSHPKDAWWKVLSHRDLKFSWIHQGSIAREIISPPHSTLPHCLPIPPASLCAMEARTLTASSNARVPSTQDDVEIVSSALPSTSKPRSEKIPASRQSLHSSPRSSRLPMSRPQTWFWSWHCLENQWDKALGDAPQVAVSSYPRSR